MNEPILNETINAQRDANRGFGKVRTLPASTPARAVTNPQTGPITIRDGVLEATALASRRLEASWRVLGLGLGLGSQVLGLGLGLGILWP